MTSISRILVTGGAGYLGSRVTAHLLQGGYAVTVFDKLVYGSEALLPFHRHGSLTLVRGDVCNAAAVGAILLGIDAIVHLAAAVGEPACTIVTEQSWSINVDGSKTVLAAARGQDRTVLYCQHLQQLWRGQARRTCRHTLGGFSNKFAAKACRQIGEALRAGKRRHTVAMVSTVIPGTSDTQFIPLLKETSGRKIGDGLFIALGEAVKGFEQPDYLLVGESDTRSGDSSSISITR
jgi:hypothetical protein